LISHVSIWLGLDGADDKKYFIFHPHNFKDEIDPLKRQAIALIDPYIRFDG
jgi:hypothetical protein